MKRSTFFCMFICLLWTSLSLNAQDNLVTNPGFEQGMSGWTTWVANESVAWASPPHADVNFEIVSPGLNGSEKALSIDIIEPGASDYYILASNQVDMEQNETYQVSLRVSTDLPRTISLGIYENVSSGGRFWRQDINVAGKDSLYGPYEFLYEKEPVKSGIKINFGGSEYGKVIIDDLNINLVGASTVKETQDTQPKNFCLKQNYPNPFNPTTHIDYSLAKKGYVTLTVRNLSGQIISTLVNETQSYGEYSVQFDGSALPSGIYFYQLKNGPHIQTKKMTLIK